MVRNPTTLVHRSPLVFRCVANSRKPISHLCYQPKFRIHPSQIKCFEVSSSCSSWPRHLNSSCRIVFNNLGSSEVGFKQSGLNNSRVWALADGGSGGTGGYGGSSDGNSGGRGGDEGGGGNKRSLLSWYLTLLEKYPVLTKAMTSAFLTFIGDLICQKVIDQVPSLDLKRIFLFTFLGLVMVGPTLHFWYLHLSKLVTLTGASGAIRRLLLDQFLFSPIFIGVFLSTLVTLEGRPSEVVPKLQQEWFSAVLANWQVWIPFQFLNFRFVPQQFQVLAANVVALAWNVILSFKAHKEIQK